MIALSSLFAYMVISILIGITAVMYSYVLTQPGEIFSWAFKKLDLFFKTDKRTSQGLGPHPVFKMIMWCEKCVAGQMSLWTFFILFWPWYRQGILVLIIPHLLLVGLAIFSALCIKKFYKSKIE